MGIGIILATIGIPMIVYLFRDNKDRNPNNVVRDRKTNSRLLVFDNKERADNWLNYWNNYYEPISGPNRYSLKPMELVGHVPFGK